VTVAASLDVCTTTMPFGARARTHRALDRVSTQAIPARLASYLLTREKSTEARPFTLGQ